MTLAIYQPNQFDLFRKDVHVQYATTGIDGLPSLDYRDRKMHKSFRGEAISVEETSIGRLVSVTIGYVPDMQTVTFSFFLPTLNVERETHVVTEAIYTTQRTSIAGPSLVKGQIESWRSITLSGMARQVQF
ncbi:hypothetical protein A7982_12430 [Minicystis rosea]|nr:hypothetical protein A7982_12430 [Minicystis rosea]